MLSFSGKGQVKILFIGNMDSICFQHDSIELSKTKKLPSDLSAYKSIFIFSNATSAFSVNDIQKLVNYLNAGGGIYCGAENWPLQAESKQLTLFLYSKESWGDFNEEKTNLSSEKTNNRLFNDTIFPAGRSTVAFPLDYRLKVEVWLEDQPLVLSGNYGNGRIVIDGGYSRFYCSSTDTQRDEILKSILKFLISHNL